MRTLTVMVSKSLAATGVDRREFSSLMFAEIPACMPDPVITGLAVHADVLNAMAVMRRPALTKNWRVKLWMSEVADPHTGTVNDVPRKRVLRGRVSWMWLVVALDEAVMP